MATAIPLDLKAIKFRPLIAHNERDWTAKELHAEAKEILDRAYILGAFFKDRGIDIGVTRAAKSKKAKN